MTLASFKTLFPVRAGERKLTFVLFLYSLFAVGAFVAARAVRDALFLAHGTQQGLAGMYVWTAVAVAVCGLLYAPVASRVRRDTMAFGSALLFGALFVAAYFAERARAPWIYSALYVYVEVMGALVIVQFWTLTNELFNPREAKRLYGFIGAGGTLSNVVIGLAGAKISTYFGASAMLVFSALLLVCCAAASLYVGRLGRQRMFANAAMRSAKRDSPLTGALTVFRSPHLRVIAGLTALTFFVITAIDFEFKVMAGAAFDKDELTAFFSYFYAAVGVLAVVLQLFGTSRIIERAGVIGSMAVLPMSLLLGNFAFALFPVLLFAAVSKGADTLFRYTITEATTQLLYLPSAPPERAASKAFIDTFVKQGSIALAGLSLLAYRTFSHDPIPVAWAGLVMCAGWVGLLFLLKPRYLNKLQDTLRRKKLDLEAARQRLQASATHGVLWRALESKDPREVLNALELLPLLENIELDHRVEALLEHELSSVRMAALHYYAKRQTLRFANSVFRRFDDADPGVRAAAIAAFCAMGRDKSVRSVRGFLADPDPRIRGAAITGMIRFGGLDGVLMAAGALKALIADGDPRMREYAAKVLGDIGVKNFYQPILELMNDADVGVRRQAIIAAGQVQSQEFVLPLIYKTAAAATGLEAVDALASFGPSIAPTLGKVLSNPMESVAVRRGAARVLGRLASEAGAEIITRYLDEPDEELRTHLYRALARAVRANKLINIDRKKVSAALISELVRAYRALAAAETLKLESAAPGTATARTSGGLLSSALQEKVARSEQRIFLLLSVLYPEAGMDHIYSRIEDYRDPDAPRKRANAVELLDNLLERSLKKKLLPLLDDMPRENKLRAVFPDFDLARIEQDVVWAELARDEVAWVRACALNHAARLKVAAAENLLELGAADQNAIVREIAIVSLAEFSTAKAIAVAKARLHDEAPIVRRQAERLAALSTA